MLTISNWQLVTKEGEPVSVGSRVTDFRGEQAILQGGRPPQKPSSEGHVWTDKASFCYASVYGLKWVKALAI